jgi:hypothetical protein
MVSVIIMRESGMRRSVRRADGAFCYLFISTQGTHARALV